MQIRSDGALSNQQLRQMLTTADHEQNSRRVPVNACQVHFIAFVAYVLLPLLYSV